MSRIKQLLFQDKLEWVGPQVAAYIVKNPTLLLTTAYILVSGLGLLYEVVLFSKFGVNVLDYSEAADFFLAAFKRPEAFFSSFAIAAVFVLYRVLANYAINRESVIFRVFLLSFSWIGLFRREILIPLGLIYFFFVFGLSAEAEARRIVFDSNDIVTISTRFGSPSEHELIPIGATERFMFGVRMSEEIISVRQASKRTEISPVVTAIPFANISRIEYSHATISPWMPPSNNGMQVTH